MKTIMAKVGAAALVAAAAWAYTAGAAVPGSEAAGNPPSKGSSAAEEARVLVERISALRPDIPIEHVSRTPLPDIYALELAGGTVFYGTADGRYLFAGDLYELGDHDLVNLAESGRMEKRRALMATVSEEDMVIFSPRGTPKAVVNVFTDVDCGFCQKLHQEVPQLNDMGVEVRYLAYPRAGIGSRSYHKIVSAWCADDPNAAITKLKAREQIPEATCENPVAEQFELGREMGVAGTPAIILEDGRMLPGYMPAAELAQKLGI